MKINRITKSLLILSVILVILDFARFDLWRTTNLLFLIWNLLLAWVPYIISYLFIKKDAPIYRFVPSFIFWLLFFPNSLYLVTDVFHIVSIHQTLLWYDSLLFFFFGWVGLFLGIVSLFHVHQYLKARLNYFIAELLIVVICFVSSFGVYLGRFGRWNSWDIFFNLNNLIKHILNISNNVTRIVVNVNPLFFIITFTILFYSVYKTVYILIEDNV